jgi:hypothetical protein
MLIQIPARDLICDAIQRRPKNFTASESIGDRKVPSAPLANACSCKGTLTRERLFAPGHPPTDAANRAPERAGATPRRGPEPASARSAIGRSRPTTNRPRTGAADRTGLTIGDGLAAPKRRRPSGDGRNGRIDITPAAIIAADP